MKTLTKILATSAIIAGSTFLPGKTNTALDYFTQASPNVEAAESKKGNLVSQVISAFLSDRAIDLAKEGKHDKAIKVLNEAIKLNPNFSEAYFNRGWVWCKKGEHDKAIEDYNEVIRLRPTDFLARYNRGVIFEKKGELDKAAKDFEEAKRLDPGLKMIRKIKGEKVEEEQQ